MRRIRLAEVGGLALVVAVGVGIPLASSVATGALDVPNVDDWAFSRIALRLADQGDLRLVGWGPMALIGHVVWAQPWLAVFGSGLRVLHLVGAATAALALVATYAVARQFLPPARSLLATALVAVAPAFALTSATFMTDTTALAAQMGCLAFGLAGLRRGADRWGWQLWVSLALGLFAFTVREVTVVASAAVVLAWLWADRTTTRERLRRLVLPAGVALVAGVAFLYWRESLAGDQAAFAVVASPKALVFSGRALFTAALALGPAAVLTGARRAGRGIGLETVTGVAIVALLGAGVLAYDLRTGSASPLLTGGFLTRQGSLASGVLLGTRPELFSAGLWSALVVLAMAGAALLTVRLTTHLPRPVAQPRRRPELVALSLFVGGTVLAANVSAFFGGVVYDRYLWPTLAGGAILLLRGTADAGRAAGRRRLAAGVWLAGLAAVSLVTTIDEQAFDVARWRAGEAAQRRGVAAADIDAGLEWVGWHHRGIAYQQGRLRIAAPHPWYLLAFEGVGNCEFVSASPIAHEDVRLVDTLAYRSAPFVGERRLYTYRNDLACGL